MKKIISLTIALLLMMAIFVSCSGNGGDDTSSSTVSSGENKNSSSAVESNPTTPENSSSKEVSSSTPGELTAADVYQSAMDKINNKETGVICNIEVNTTATIPESDEPVTAKTTGISKTKGDNSYVEITTVSGTATNVQKLTVIGNDAYLAQSLADGSTQKLTLNTENEAIKNVLEAANNNPYPLNADVLKDVALKPIENGNKILEVTLTADALNTYINGLSLSLEEGTAFESFSVLLTFSSDNELVAASVSATMTVVTGGIAVKTTVSINTTYSYDPALTISAPADAADYLPAV